MQIGAARRPFAAGVGRTFLAAFLALFAFLAAAAEVPVPPLQARVTDLTGTLTAEQRAGIEARLAAFEQRKGSQIAVLIVPTTQPEEIEQFGIRVVDAWKLGRKGIADGALLLVAMKDRRVRIEVGRGLEGVLTDATSKRIIAEDITPRFKQGDYFGGIDIAVTRMMSVIDGEPLPPPKAAEQRRDSAGSIGEVFLLMLVLIVVVGGMLRAMFGRFFGSLLVGGSGGVIGWLLLGSLIGGIAVGIVGTILSLMGGTSSRRLGRSTWGGIPGGWSGGGWGGGGWGGGGGGFSGGGGDFGGGGASGSW